MLKVSSIRLLFDDWMYISNPQNDDFNNLPFYGDERLITGQWIYCVNYDIVERLNNGLILDAYKNWMLEE